MKIFRIQLSGFSQINGVQNFVHVEVPFDTLDAFIDALNEGRIVRGAIVRTRLIARGTVVATGRKAVGIGRAVVGIVEDMPHLVLDADDPKAIELMAGSRLFGRSPLAEALRAESTP